MWLPRKKLKDSVSIFALLITINLIRKIFVIFEGSNNFSLHQASHLSIHRASDSQTFNRGLVSCEISIKFNILCFQAYLFAPEDGPNSNDVDYRLRVYHIPIDCEAFKRCTLHCMLYLTITATSSIGSARRIIQRLANACGSVMRSCLKRVKSRDVLHAGRVEKAHASGCDRLYPA